MSAHFCHVLVAEDDPVNRGVMREMLHQLGYTAYVVDNGAAALAALDTGKYALALLDCQMPELDGYQATRAIRAREKPGEHLPIIAVTAHALVGDRQRALDAGMDDSLSKPINSDGLLAMLERWGSLVEGPISEGPNAERVPGASPALLDLNPTVPRSPTVVRLFKKHGAAQVAELLAALESDDREAIRSVAHKLKGSSVVIGAEVLAELCAVLETGPGERTVGSELAAAFERVFTLLEA